MDLLLFGHGGSCNHGCEAIVRSTAGIFSGEELSLYSYRPNEDYSYRLEDSCRIVSLRDVPTKRMSWNFIRAYLRMKLKKDDTLLLWYNEKNLISQESTAHDVALSIGGDNYCYSKAGARRFAQYRQAAQANGLKTVLWGCSIEPNLIDDELRADLKHYDLIVARESITYDAVKDVCANVFLAPDPAFSLPRQSGTYPVGLGKHPYIGLNVSPLVQNLEHSKDITLRNYQMLIHRILDETDRDIVLIPHVVWEGNDDRTPLSQLYSQFRGSGRVFIVEDQNCMQLKDIISGCEFFVGARTHSTIAAYSTCVPTLVVGYSVKARGIARDLFGSE